MIEGQAPMGKYDVLMIAAIVAVVAIIVILILVLRT
jgi:hypothetical protein